MTPLILFVVTIGWFYTSEPSFPHPVAEGQTVVKTKWQAHREEVRERKAQRRLEKAQRREEKRRLRELRKRCGPNGCKEINEEVVQ